MTAKKTTAKPAKPAETAVDTGERGALDTSKLGATAEATVAPTAETAQKGGKNSTVFTFKNGGTREFSKDVHGAKWEDLADEFQATNAKTIAFRDGKDLA